MVPDHCSARADKGPTAWRAKVKPALFTGAATGHAFFSNKTGGKKDGPGPARWPGTGF